MIIEIDHPTVPPSPSRCNPPPPPCVCVLLSPCCVSPASARRSPAGPDPHRLNEDGELWLLYEGLKETNRCCWVLCDASALTCMTPSPVLFCSDVSFLFFPSRGRGNVCSLSLSLRRNECFSHSSRSVSQALVRCHVVFFFPTHHLVWSRRSKRRGLACSIDHNLSELLVEYILDNR